MPSPSAELGEDITRTDWGSPPVDDEMLRDALDARVADEQIELPDFASSQPPMHVALTEAQLRMQATLPPLPMVGGVRDLLALAGGVALDGGDARSSEHCASTTYRGTAASEHLGIGDTDKVPAFHFDQISDMSDDEVELELASLLATEGARVERRIMLYLARRHFTLGLSAYGPVKLFDGRDNVKEMREECADFLFYFGKEQLEREAR